MDTDPEALATALHVTADDLLKAHPEITPARPRVGIAPSITDAEVLTLAAIAPLVGIDTKRRFLRYARKHLRGMFPRIPGQSGLQQAPARPGRHHRVAGGRAGHHQRAHRRRAPGRLHLHRVRPLPAHRTTLGPGRLGRLRVLRLLLPLPLGPAPDRHPRRPSGGLGAHQFEPGRARGPAQHARAPGAHTIITDKGYRSRDLEDDLNQAGPTLLRPAARNETPRPGAGLLRPVRQRIESVFDTLKGQLKLECHSGSTPTGVTARIAQRILAPTTTI